MKNGIIYYPNSQNIGDDIQTYAASLLVKEPVFCNRERLDEITEETKLLCSGWFMHDAQHWPPSKFIKPLFESFHISGLEKGCVEKMTNVNSLKYFKQHEPIGCRDYYTVELLESKGIKAFFTGCLTLSIPKYTGEKNAAILIVNLLRNNYTTDYRETIIKHLIPQKYLNKVEFISHLSSDIPSKDKNTRMNDVKTLLVKYGKAKLVITSLIHCALPCVALGTPVVFIDFGFNNSWANRDRFKGITDMFEVYSNIDMPLMGRDIFSKGARYLGLHRLMTTGMNPLPEEIFEYSEIKTNHINLVEGMKNRVGKFFE